MKRFFAMLLVFVMLFNICASAIVLDVAEDVVEDVAELASEEEAVAEVQSTELDIPLYDPTYGRLVYYNNFESQELNSDATGTYYTYCNTSFIDATNAPVKVGALNDIRIVDDPVNGGNKVVKVINTATGRQYTQFWLSSGGDFTAVGTYTVVFDVTASANIPIKLRHHEDGAAGSTVQVLTTTANKWTTGAKSIELVPYAERDSGTYTVKHGWMHTDYTVSESNVDDASFYIDNVRIYYLPKGKITQESLNIPEGATVYKKAADGEKPAEFVLDTTKSNYVGLTDSLYIPGYSFLGWYDADGNKMTPETFTISSTHGAKALSAQWQENAPGLNMLTGTAEAADFEDGNTYNIGVQGNNNVASKVNVVDNAVVNAGTGNATRVLHSNGVTSWNQIFIPADLVKDKMYELKYDAFLSAAPNGGSYGYTAVSGVYDSTNNSDYRFTSSGASENNKAGMWTTQNIVVQPSVDVADDVIFINTEFKNNPTQDIYFDNMSVTPYYEIKYVDLDGTESVVYALRDAEGNILTSYTPDSANFASGAQAYKLSEDGEMFGITTPVALSNENVTLYAVDANLYKTEYVASGVEGTVATVKFTKTLDAENTTYDVGNSEAEVVVGEDTVTVTATGYAGVVTINAVYTDGDAETKTVRLLGGTKWKPGLNIITGTPDGFDFEGLTDEELALAVSVSTGEGTGIVTDGDSQVLKLSGAAYVNATVNLTNPIVDTRRVMLTMDCKGTYTNMWLIFDDSNNKKIYPGNKETWSLGAFHEKTGPVNSSITVNVQKSGDAFYMDNLALVPAYKVTYVDTDGTETVKYADFTSDFKVVTSYTPDAANFASGATFYKLSEDGEVLSIDTPISLNYEDVTIYAVEDNGLDIETTDPVYGELIYYNNFESFNYVVGESAHGTNYTYKTDRITSDINLKDAWETGSTRTIAGDPVDAESDNKVVKVTPGSGDEANPNVFFAGGNISGAGTYTFVVDYTADDGVTGANFGLEFSPRFNKDGNVRKYYSLGSVNDGNRGQWNTAAYQVTLVDEIDDTDATYKYFDHIIVQSRPGTTGYDVSKYNYYLDNVRIYFKPYENNAVSGVAGSEKVVNFTKTLDTEKTTVDVGNSEAEVVVGENTVTVTATGYSGVVTINAVYTDGETETKTVRILGGDLWKPGLNIITGTAEGLDFEGLTADDVALALKRWDSSSTLAINPNADGDNTSANVYKISGETGEQYTGFDVNISKSIEEGRGVFLTMNYMGSWDNNFWLNGSKNNGIQGHLTNNTSEWKNSLIYYYNDSFTTRVGLQTKNVTGTSPSAVYVDDLAFIPAYKFTYIDIDGTTKDVYAIHDAEGKLLTAYTPDAENFASGAAFYKLSENGEVYSIDTPISLNYQDVTIYAVEDNGLDIETTDPVYGELIYYNNFESYNYVVGESAHGTTYTYKTDKITKDISLGDAWGTATRTIAGDPVNAESDNKVVKVTPVDGNGANHDVFFANGNISGEGIYTFVVDYTANAGVTDKTFGLEFSPRFDYDNAKRKYYSLGAVSDDTRGVWNTAAYQFELGDTYTSVGHIIVQSRTGTTGYDVDDYTYYIDNVKIYFKPYATDVANYVASGKDGTVTTVRFAKELDTEKTTYNVGNSEATVEFDGSKAIVTATGYAGVVTINAVFTDETTETKTVTLLGGTKWKPGLNILTGTPDVLDFEGLTDKELAVVLTTNPAGTLVTDEDSQVVKLTGSEYVGFTVPVTEAIEAARNAYVKMNHKGTYSNAWYYNDSTASAQALGTSGDSWTFTIFNKSGDINESLGINIKKTSDVFYIDNLSLIPRYKVTYVDLDGTEVVTYLGVSNTTTWNYDETFTPNASKFASGATLYKLSNAEDAELFTIDTPVALNYEDITLYAVKDNGLDIETTDPDYGELIYYNNFNSLTYTVGESAHGTHYTYKTDKVTKDVNLTDAWGTATRTIAVDPVNTESDNKVVMVTPINSDGVNHDVFFANGNVSGEGIYTFVVDYTANGDVENKTFGLEFSPRFNGARKYYSLAAVDNSTRGVWNTAAYQFELGDGADGKYTSFDHIIVQSRTGTTGYNVDDYTYYLDNVRIYFKPYPTDATNYVGSGKEGTVTTARFAKTLDAELTTVDLGNSEATFEIVDNKCRVTSTGYSGVVTINAVYTDGETETKTVKLLGGTKWKPGLNIITGTTEAIDFEELTDEELALAVEFTGSEADSFKANLVTDNGSQAVKLTGSAYVGFKVSVAEAIEAERNAYISLSHMGTYSNSWYYNDSTASSQGLGGSSNSWKFTIFNKNGAINSLLSMNIQKSADAFYIDNLSVVPRYKVTYVDVDGTETVTYLGITNTETWSYDATFTPNVTKFASGAVKYKLSDAEDAEVFFMNEPIALEYKDITIYAVESVPTTVETQDMRFDGEENVTASMRFKGIISAEQRDEAAEYGMLVTRKTFLDQMSAKAENGEDVETELTFDFNYNGVELFIYGEAYRKVGDTAIVDKHSNIDEDGNYTISAVLKGITNDDADRVNEVFVIRPYIKFNIDGKEVVCYGKAVENSLVNVAKTLDRAGLSDAINDKLDSIIALAK